MTLFEQWELINYIANKDYGGNVLAPNRFEQLAKVANLDLFKQKFGLPEEYQLGAPISRQYLDASQRITDETIFLKVTSNVTPTFPDRITWPQLPNYFTLVSMSFNYQRTIDGGVTTVPVKVEVLTRDEFDDRAGNWTKKPSLKNPVAYLDLNGINLIPDLSQVTVTFIRYPTEPSFDYVQQPGYIEDGGGSLQYEWPQHLHMDLTRIILGYMGINMREQELQQYAETHKQQGI